VSVVRNLFTKTFYYAKTNGVSISNNREIETFQEPVRLQYNVQPLSGDLDFAMYGERARQMKRMIVDNNATNRALFTRLSRAYFDGVTPLTEIVYGSGANYRVVDVREFHKSLHVIFELIPTKG
jgi:hypothetical protein